MEKVILEMLLMLLKILLYSYMRIVLDATLADCYIYNSQGITLNFNIRFGDVYSFQFKTNYMFFIPLDKIYFDYTYTHMDTKYIIDMFGQISTTIQQVNQYLTNFISTHEITSIIDLNKYYIENFISEIKPIEYISFKNKYLKYKQKYLNLKKKFEKKLKK
jgi:hypothetical protein